MPDLQHLLDQIDRLDQEATKGPWMAGEPWAEISSGSDSVIHGYYDGQCPACAEEINDDARVAISPEDTEFIALARTALPQLAQALRAVMELHKPRSHEETPDDLFCNMCGNYAPCETFITITDALGGDDG